MSTFDERIRVQVGDVSIEIPRVVQPLAGDPVDSTAAVFDGEGLHVVVDQGPFAASLDVHVGQPGYAQELTELAGSPARLVVFREGDGATYVSAVELLTSPRATVVVRADRSVPRDVAHDISHSVQVGR